MKSQNIFISYRRGIDNDSAGRVYDRLCNFFGESQVFRDVDASTELVGIDFVDVLEKQIGACSAFIIVIGPGWIENVDRLSRDDDFVRIEIESALRRSDIRVIPVLVEDVDFPEDDQLPESLRQIRRRGALRLRNEDYASPIQTLIDVLRGPSKVSDAPSVANANFVSAEAQDPTKSKATNLDAFRGEQRQVTALSCSLHDMEMLAARYDPDEIARISEQSHEACARVVTGWGGNIVSQEGSTMLAFFGLPTAQEDDAVRAVHAGLSLGRQALAVDGPESAELKFCIGIATGIVTVAEEQDDDGMPEITGEVLVQVERMRAQAGEAQTVVARTTQRLLGTGFDFAPAARPAGRQDWAGQAVISAREPESVLGNAEARASTPLVGRRNELGILSDRWAWTKDGDGQVVLLGGEAGIGKSRLIGALMQQVQSEVHTTVQLFCSPYHSNSAFHPVIRHIERIAGFAPEHSPAQRLERLAALVPESTPRRTEVTLLVASLLSIPVENDLPSIELSPEQRKRRTLEALCDLIVALAKQRPVLLICEDVHWIDPSTFELLTMTIDRVRRIPVMLAISFRPDFVAPWIGQAHVTVLHLNRLGRKQSEAIVARLSETAPLPDAVADQILSKADGIPLYVEELTKAVLDSGIASDLEHGAAISGKLDRIEIPASLSDSLMARLDRLSPVKEVAQFGAVIGREFSHELIATVTNQPEQELRAALAQLTQAELIFQVGTPPAATYTFKHALIRDAAYYSLLKPRRQQIHARIAQALQQANETRKNEYGLELLAQHFTQAGQTDVAVTYWQRAANRALGRSENKEAISLLQSGLDLVGEIPDKPQRQHKELELRIAIGVPYIAVKGYSAPEVEESYSRAYELCEALGSTREKATVLQGLWAGCFVRGELARAHGIAEQLVQASQNAESALRAAHAHRAIGSTLFYMGEFEAAAKWLDRGIALQRDLQEWGEHRTHLLAHGEHPGVHCLLYSAWTEWFLGNADRASEAGSEALDLSRRFSHHHSIALAMGFNAVLLSLRRDFDAALRQADEGIAFAQKHDLPQSLAKSTFCRGISLVNLGEPLRGLAAIEEAERIWHRIKARLVLTQWLGLKAEANIALSRFEDAAKSFAEARNLASATGEAYYLAEIDRLEGTARLATGDRASATTLFERAISRSRQQGAKSLEWQATVSLAKLHRSQGEQDRALDLLATAKAAMWGGSVSSSPRETQQLMELLGPATEGELRRL